MRGGEGDFGIVKGEIGNEEGGALVQEGLGWDGQGIQKERAEDGTKGENQAFGRPRLPPSLQDKTTSHPQSRTHTPPHCPLEPIPYINVHTYPYTFTSHTQFHSITNTQDTHRRGGFQHFSTTIAVPNLFFFHTPPFMPNNRKFPTRPPVLFIKVFPHPPTVSRIGNGLSGGDGATSQF